MVMFQQRNGTLLWDSDLVEEVPRDEHMIQLPATIWSFPEIGVPLNHPFWNILDWDCL